MTETPPPPPPDDQPDALSEPEVDEVRGSDEGDAVTGDADDSYELRSMPTQPNPTEDDPASFLGT